ncbi:MAG: 50S ribosomal protein L3 [Syntrophothermus sp.]
MAKGILGKKLGMTQIFNTEGAAVPVTVIEAGPCVVVQHKTVQNDGYAAVQVAFGQEKENAFNKPIKGHFAKVNLKPRRFVREFRAAEGEMPAIGEEIKADIFSEGEFVDVIGTSKGKGYAGAIKRWNFNRGPMRHGSMYHRRPGALNATDPARVFKGRRLPGRMGDEQVTVHNLQVIKVDQERNLLLVKGAVPGVRGALVVVREAVKAKK